MIYEICKKLIEKNLVEGLLEKIEVFYKAGKLTQEEYEKLKEMI